MSNSVSFIVREYPDFSNFWGATKSDNDKLLMLSAKKIEIIDKLEKDLRSRDEGGDIRVNNTDGSMQFKIFVPSKIVISLHGDEDSDYSELDQLESDIELSEE